MKILSSWKWILLSPRLFFFTLSQSYAVFITLQWDANQEPDLNHYVVYWGTSLGSYSDNSGNIDKSETTYTVTGLSGGTTYYLAVKTYDDQGRESDYSNEVSTDEVSAGDSATTASASGDGNGGCFIATSGL